MRVVSSDKSLQQEDTEYIAAVFVPADLIMYQSWTLVCSFLCLHRHRNIILLRGGRLYIAHYSHKF